MPLVALASAPSRANLLRITTIDHGACRYCIAMGTATRSHRLAVLLHGRSCEGSLHLTPILQFNLAQTGFRNISLIAMGSRRHLRRDKRTQSPYYNARARIFREVRDIRPGAGQTPRCRLHQSSLIWQTTPRSSSFDSRAWVPQSGVSNHYCLREVISFMAPVAW